MRLEKQRLYGELAVHGVILLVLACALFPGVLRGKLISPADVLFQAVPWKYYAPAGMEPSPHKLMSDVITAFHPYYVMVRRALDNGEWPLWNDLELMGIPLMANSQSAVFYPPRLLHAFLNIPLATTMYIMLKLWLCGMTAYICGRGIGLRVGASRIASVGWMLSSYNVIWCNWSLPDVSAWIPVLFLGVESALAAKYRRGFLLVAVGGILILLAGHPETAFTFSLGLCVYFMMRLALERRWGRALWMPVGVFAGAWAIALLVCAPQLLALGEYLRNSATFFERASGEERHLLRPGALVSFFLPRFFGASRDGNFWGGVNSNLDSMAYPGIAILLGISLLLVERADGGRRCDPRAAALAISVAFQLLMAMDAPVAAALNRLPVMGSLRFCYHVSWVMFALVILAAMGIERWLSRPRKLMELGWSAAPVIVGGGLIYFMYSLSSGYLATAKMTGYVNAQIATATICAAAALTMLALHCFRVNPRLITIGLAVVLAGDLLWANRGLNPTTKPENIFPDTALTSRLQSLGPHRMGLAEGNIPSALMVSYGIEEWLGYDGLYPGRTMRLFKGLGPDMWGGFEPLRSIQYFLNDPEMPSIPADKLAAMQKIDTADGIEIYRNVNALPRAFLVGHMRETGTFEQMLEVMRDPAFDPRKEVLVERMPENPINALAADLGTVKITQRKSTYTVIEADVREDCALVLTDSWYPGWTAAIDSKRTPVFPAYYIFRGIIVPEGRHTIVFSYFPGILKLGLAISVLTLLGVNAWVLRALARLARVWGST